MKNGAAVDLATLENAREIFGEENLFTNIVNNMERLKRYDITGITNEDMHDRKVHKSYADIADEFIARVEAELAEV